MGSRCRGRRVVGGKSGFGVGLKKSEEGFVKEMRIGISKEKRKEASGKTKGGVDKATTIESSGGEGEKRSRRRTIKSWASSEENQRRNLSERLLVQL